ncbi:MAG: M55 family metallopeptidase [Chloroflexota bacterium]
MNVYMSVDVEGVAGIADWSQIIAGEHDYAVGRALMVDEVNAAVEGAFAAGAKRVVVNDAHSHMLNLLPQKMDSRVRLISGKFKPMYMMQGLDSGFDAAFFIGYHGGIGAPEAILSHTYNPRAIWEAKINGTIVGELGLNLLVCDYFGVPLRLVSGDQAVALEARETVTGVHVAEVKRSFGRYSAESLSPSDACDVIRREAEASLAALPRTEPVRRAVEVELTFLVADMATMAEWIRGVERIGPRIVVLRGANGLEAYHSFNAINTLCRSIAE